MFELDPFFAAFEKYFILSSEAPVTYLKCILQSLGAVVKRPLRKQKQA